MLTFYFIGLIAFWAGGLWLWNRLYPKHEEGGR